MAKTLVAAMPDRHRLRVGDRIRLIAVPDTDIRGREREVGLGLDDAGWTADTIEAIIAQDPVVTISSIDEYGKPWFEYHLRKDHGKTEEHSIAIIDDDSWIGVSMP